MHVHSEYFIIDFDGGELEKKIRVYYVYLHNIVNVYNIFST